MMTTLAAVFPGQGAQSVGMINALANEFPAVQLRYEAASEVLGFDLWKLTNEGPAEDLNQTRNTQPALLAASVATWDIWLSIGGARPSLLAGHSFGEYSALVCAGALKFEDAVGLVAIRGRLMQEAVGMGVGAMAAVLGLEFPELQAICTESAGEEVVECANLNAPGQIVISGNSAAVARAGELARARGAKRVIPLTVSVPAHCALMSDAAARYHQFVDAVAVQPPVIPVIHNTDVKPHSDPASIRKALLEQLAKPVRWQETITYFASAGIRQIIECGPGKVLGPLIKRCASEISVAPLGSPEELRKARDSLKGQPND